MASTGREYEEIWAFVLAKAKMFQKASVEEDLYEGTDGYIWGIPVDFTHAFGVKSNIQMSKYIKDLDIYMGIRTGKKHKPVVVLGHEAEPFYLKSWILPNLETFISENKSRIADEVADLYWAFCDK